MLFKRLGIVAILLWIAVVGQRESSAQKFLFLVGPAPCTQATKFLNTVSLSTAYQAAIITYICGRVTSGVFAKLDLWYAFQTQNATTALTNLILPGLYNGVATGAPTFTANSGYKGTEGSTIVYVDTAFNPTTAVSPNYTRNAGSIHAWVVTVPVTSTNAVIGAYSTTQQTSIFPRRTSDGLGYYRINDGASASAGVATPSALGFYSAVRTGASAQNGYKNAVDQGVTSVASGAVLNGTFHALGMNSIGGAGNAGSGATLSMVAIGGILNSSDVTDLCHATNVYLNAISGLALGTC